MHASAVAPHHSVPASDRLSGCPALAPQLWQERLFDEAVARTRESMALPRRLSVCWRNVPSDAAIADAAAWHVAASVVRIDINGNLPPEAARWLIYRELFHAHAFLTGLRVIHPDVTLLELHQMATIFAANMTGCCA